MQRYNFTADQTNRKVIEVYNDEYFMKLAIAEARKAYDMDEVPIGAVLVYQNTLLSRNHNQTELLHDVTAHAEILAISSASQYMGSKYLQDCTLYVTLEPCPMCAAAMRWSQLGKLVYAAEDEKAGYLRFGNGLLHPKTKIEFGLLREESADLLKSFFKSKRKLRSK